MFLDEFEKTMLNQIKKLQKFYFNLLGEKKIELESRGISTPWNQKIDEDDFFQPDVADELDEEIEIKGEKASDSPFNSFNNADSLLGEKMSFQRKFEEKIEETSHQINDDSGLSDFGPYDGAELLIWNILPKDQQKIIREKFLNIFFNFFEREKQFESLKNFLCLEKDSTYLGNYHSIFKEAYKYKLKEGFKDIPTDFMKEMLDSYGFNTFAQDYEKLDSNNTKRYRCMRSVESDLRGRLLSLRKKQRKKHF